MATQYNDQYEDKFQNKTFIHGQNNMAVASVDTLLIQDCSITENWKKYDYSINRCLKSNEIEFYLSSKTVINTAKTHWVYYEYSDVKKTFIYLSIFLMKKT